MKRASIILIGAGCLLLLLISWIVTMNSKSSAEKQLELMRQAAELIDDGIYIRAVPLLEEAAGYNAAHTKAAEEELKIVYLELIGQRGYNRKYTSLLEKQMNQRDAGPEVFAEAAKYYLNSSRISDALKILTEGIERTGSYELVALYESNRYAYELSRTSYENVSAIHGSAAQVQIDGLWGLARADGSQMIPCEYDKVSTFSVDRAIVRKNGVIYAIDRNNNRIALLNENASDIGNLAENRIPLLIDGSWRRATGEFVLGTSGFEQLGTYSGGYVAAKTDGKWGVVDLVSNWLVPAEYDEIICDELGRCYARGAVFARNGDFIYLLVEGQRVGFAYEDARPFTNDGYAAVKRYGKWGFIDTNGAVMIGFRFDDALSFGQHLAAVKQDGYWGYISRSGRVVIEPVFLEAKSFSNGSAPVLTQRGWQFITLLEYKRGVSL